MKITTVGIDLAKNVYMDTAPFAKIFVGVLGQIGCSFISGLLCRSIPAGPDGIR